MVGGLREVGEARIRAALRAHIQARCAALPIAITHRPANRQGYGQQHHCNARMAAGFAGYAAHDLAGVKGGHVSAACTAAVPAPYQSAARVSASTPCNHGVCECGMPISVKRCTQARLFVGRTAVCD